MTPPDQPMDISNLGDGVTTIMAEMDRMRHEIARLRATIAALREPSEAVILAMQLVDAHGDVTDAQCDAMLCAAVAAAERQVTL